VHSVRGEDPFGDAETDSGDTIAESPSLVWSEEVIARACLFGRYSFIDVIIQSFKDFSWIGSAGVADHIQCMMVNDWKENSYNWINYPPFNMITSDRVWFVRCLFDGKGHRVFSLVWYEKE